MILDILLIAFLILQLTSGWRHGFVRSFFGLVGFFAALILTKVFYLPFTEFLYETPIYQKLAEAVASSTNIELPTFLPPAFTEALGITDALASLSLNILSILTYLVLFILIYLVLSLLVRLLDGVFKLPVLKFANRFLGLLLNGLKGVLLCYILAVILQFFRADIVAESRILTNLLTTVPGLAEMLF